MPFIHTTFFVNTIIFVFRLKQLQADHVNSEVSLRLGLWFKPTNSLILFCSLDHVHFQTATSLIFGFLKFGSVFRRIYYTTILNLFYLCIDKTYKQYFN